MAGFVIYRRDGSAKGTGGGSPPAPLQVVGNAGLKLGGAALFHFAEATVGNAGLVVGGGAFYRFVTVTTGDGGLTVGGGADYRFPVRTIGNAGLKVGDGALLGFAYQIVGNAGLKLGGGAEFGEPVHWWRFGENTGTTAADTGTGPAITISSVDGWTTTDLPTVPAGNVSAARLSGTAAQMNYASDILPDVTGDFTVMGRSRINRVSLDFTEVDFIGTGAAGAFVYAETTTSFGLSGGVGMDNFVGSGTIPAETWFHWCIRRRKSDNQVDVLLDGVVSASGTATGDPLANSGYVTLQTSVNPLTTDHIDFRVYNRYVEDAELDGIINGVLSPVITDEFTDTNGTALSAHTPDLGPTWVYFNSGAYGHGPWEIQNNGATQLNTSANPSKIYEAWRDAGVADGVCVTTFTTTASHNNAPGVLFRLTDASNNYVAVCACTDGTLTIYKVVAAGFTAIGTAATGLTFQNNSLYTITVTCDGDDFIARVDGPSVSGEATATDSTYPTQTKWGIWMHADTTTNVPVEFHRHEVSA